MSKSTPMELRALDRILALAPHTMVPGEVMGLDGIRSLRSCFEFVESEEKRYFHLGVSELDTCRRIDLGPFAK